MTEPGHARLARGPDPPKPGLEPRFERFVDTGGQGIVRRAASTLRHGLALAFGGLGAWTRDLPDAERTRPRFLLLRAFAAVGSLPVSRRVRRQPLPVQLRLRLEMLGPTYIKLGQILSLREDLLPKAVTDELGRLLDRLPAVPYEQVIGIVERELRRPVDEVFAHVRSTPLGSASIGQTHVATTLAGEQVVLKVVKPGIRRTLRRDTLLLRLLGRVLQLFLPRFQPRRVIDEFCHYTLREADLSYEADNAETFAANFRDHEGVVFPRIHRELSTASLLTMELLEGIQPNDPRALALRAEDRERLVALGAEAIISMLYRDGFFHADLHPANLLVLPGPKIGFVDLGIVGRLEADVKRALLYYYYCLVIGDTESAAGYLAALAEPGPGADLAGFRRDVEEVSQQWLHRARFASFSVGRLILQSIGYAARRRVSFPVEMVLMVKALATFEAVGNRLLPGFDVVKVSRPHVHRILLERFAPTHLAQESLTALPELADAMAKVPRLIIEGLHLVEKATRRPAENPLAGLRASLFGGACLVAGAVLIAFDGPRVLGAALLLAGVLVALRRA